MEVIEQPIDSVKPGGRYSVQIQRNGDLAGQMYLRVGVPAITGDKVANGLDSNDPVNNTKVAWVRRLGHALIKSVEVEIGGSTIDKQYGVWLDIWYELTHTVEQESNYRRMIGDIPELTTLTGSVDGSSSDVVLPAHTLYIPLQFWFCRNTGLALPLIALQYHEVRVYVELEDLNKLICWSGLNPPSLSNFSFTDGGIMVDYIYLDSEERRRFAQVGHEYLIEQVQHAGEETLNANAGNTTTSQKFKLDFNHPTKELVWALKCGAFNGEAQKSSLTGSRGRFLCYTNSDADGAWDTALNWAARNIASGMFIATTNTATINSDANGSWDSLDFGDQTVSGNSVGTVVILGSSLPSGASLDRDITINFVINNTTGNDISGEQNIAVNLTPLVKNGHNFGEDMVEITVYLTATDVDGSTHAITEIKKVGVTDTDEDNQDLTAASAAALPYNCVVVNEHTLTLSDVSVPVEDMTTDTRAYVVAGDDRCKWDVTVVQPSNYGTRLDGQGSPVLEGNITLNGHERFAVQKADYFNCVVPSKHHTRGPARGVYVYSFGIHPEQHQPSGSANLSRIDSTLLVLKFKDSLRDNATVKFDFTTDSKFYIFAFSYNVLRVMSGILLKQAPVPKSQLPIKLIKNTLWGKQCKIDHVLLLCIIVNALYNWLVNLFMKINLQQFQTAGISSQLKNTTSIEKSIEGSRLIAEPDGNNFLRLDNPHPSFFYQEEGSETVWNWALYREHKIQSGSYGNI